MLDYLLRFAFFLAFFFVAFFLAFFLVAIKISLFNVKFRFSALTLFKHFILNVFNVKWIFIGKEAKEKNKTLWIFFIKVCGYVVSHKSPFSKG